MANLSCGSREHALVKAARAGDRDALDRLIGSIADEVVAFVKYKVPQEGVDDVVQEVLLDVIEMLPKLEEPRAFRGSLWTIARRRVADYHRTRSAVDEAGSSDIADPDTIAQEGELARVEDRMAYEGALHALPRCSRVIVRLHLEREWSFAEVARRVGGTEGGARVRYHRAKSKIRQVAM